MLLTHWAEFVFLLHVCATLMMVGLIWFVQRVHYPLLDHIPAAQLPTYEQLHTRWITPLVAPLMLVEFATGIVLCWEPPPGISLALPSAGLGMIVVIWASTWGIQIPCHEALCRSHDSATIRRLVRSNWIRTIAWSIRGVLVLAMLAARTS